MPSRFRLQGVFVVLVVLHSPLAALFADGSDVIVGSLPSMANYPADGDIDAFSVATTSCNIGDEPLDWVSGTDQHPVIGQNMFRLKDGRFEHIGMSWLKHGFFALQGSLCEDDPDYPDCDPNPNGGALGVGCSDPYSATLNGSQSGLGPRWQVNPTLGDFTYPPDDPDFEGTIARRLQVHVDDLDPDLNDGALYFVEGHYIHPDDARMNNDDNNASYRQVTISEVEPGEYNATTTGMTHRTEPAILAWQAEDADVEIVYVDRPGDGRYIVGYKVTELDDGYWHYEYAVHNLNSNLGGGSFHIPIPEGLGVRNLGFHDVDYHSGEPFSGEDWEITVESSEIEWSTESYLDNGDANALRWGSLYNFRFEANAPPIEGDGTIGMFEGNATEDFATLVPSDDFTRAPESLLCDPTPSSVTLEWTNGETYDEIVVTRDGETLATLSGDDTSYEDVTVIPGLHSYGVMGFVGSAPSGQTSCTVEVPEPLSIGYPDGIESLLPPAGYTLVVSIEALDGYALQSGSTFLHYDTGSGYEDVELEATVADLHDAVFPDLECGTAVSWYISAETESGELVRDPPGGPLTPYEGVVALSFELTFDDLEIDADWTVGADDDDATAGLWVHGDPRGTVAQPEDDHTPAGLNCWFTGQGGIGGSSGSADVDGGKTSLISPILDLSGWIDPVLSYWRWYDNASGATANADVFIVEVSDDGDVWTEVESVGPDGPGTEGGWIYHDFRVLEFVTLLDSVQLRFVASDEGGPSLVEAAVDDLTVQGEVCFVDCNANGVDDVAEIADGSVDDCNQNGIPDDCDLDLGFSFDIDGNDILDVCETPAFVRGDCNATGGVDISDAISALAIMFLDGGPADCDDACDINDSGTLALDDVIAILDHLFGGSAPPAAPFPDCGQDFTADSLSCESYSSCP